MIANRSISTDLRGTASTVKNRAPTPTRPVHCQSVGAPTPLRLVHRQQLGASTPPRLFHQRLCPTTDATAPPCDTADNARTRPPTPQPQPEHPSFSRYPPEPPFRSLPSEASVCRHYRTSIATHLPTRGSTATPERRRVPRPTTTAITRAQPHSEPQRRSPEPRRSPDPRSRPASQSLSPERCRTLRSPRPSPACSCRPPLRTSRSTGKSRDCRSQHTIADAP